MTIKTGERTEKAIKIFGLEFLSWEEEIFLDGFKLRLSKIENERTILEVENKKLHTKIGEDKKRITKLEDDLKTYRTKLRQFEDTITRLDTIKKNHEHARKELSGKNTKIAELERRNRELTTNSNIFRDEKNRLQREFDSKCKENNKIKNSLITKEEEVSDIRKRLENLEKKNKSLSNLNDKLRDQVPYLIDGGDDMTKAQIKKNLEIERSKKIGEEILPMRHNSNTVQFFNTSSKNYDICMNISAKSGLLASESQDAVAVKKIRNGFHITIADGVSTSHRQAEWAKRLVGNIAKKNKFNPLDIIDIQKEHQEMRNEITPFLDKNMLWIHESKLDKESHSTLMSCIIKNDHIISNRCGDLWMAGKNNSDNSWTILVDPSSENGTKAVASNSDCKFVKEKFEMMDELLIMTDGVSGTSNDFLDELNLISKTNNIEEKKQFILKHRQNGNIEEDDVTFVNVVRK